VVVVSERLVNHARARLISRRGTFITILISKYKCLVCIFKANTWRKIRIDIGNEKHNKQFFYTATRIQRCTKQKNKQNMCIYFLDVSSWILLIKVVMSINAQKLRHWITYAFDFEQNHTVESLCMFLYASVNTPLWYNGFCCISFGF